MRKIKFQKFVPAIATKEYAASTGRERLNFPKENKWTCGTNTWTEYIFDGWFHEFNRDSDGNVVAVIESEGIVLEISVSSLKFTDNIESESLYEFAKAAMQGMLSSGKHFNTSELVNLSILTAYEMLHHLKM